MKVDLEKLRLGVTAMTDEIVVGIPSKDNKSLLHQKVVTNDFIAALIDWNGGCRRIITSSDGTEWEIIVKKTKKTEQNG